MILGILTLFGLSHCGSNVLLDSPLHTVRTLETAIHHEDWKTAKKCFSQEIQQANEEIIETSKFYYTDYWTTAGTIQNIFGPIRIFYDVEELTLKMINDNEAEVLIQYKIPHEKEIRIKSFPLEKSDSAQWLITRVYSVIKPM
jgi:hypothetical protein